MQLQSGVPNRLYRQPQVLAGAVLGLSLLVFSASATATTPDSQSQLVDTPPATALDQTIQSRHAPRPAPAPGSRSGPNPDRRRGRPIPLSTVDPERDDDDRRRAKRGGPPSRFRSMLDRWKRKGITVRGDYHSESAHNFSGGPAVTGYAQQLDIGFDLDLQKLAGWQGQSFHFTLGDRFGDSVSAESTHNIFQIQQVYGLNLTRVYELSYRYTTANKGFDVRFGWFATGADFGNSPLFCKFESLAFCGHPMLLSGDSGWVNIPSGRWGFRLRWTQPEFYEEFGLFNANSTYAEDHNHLKMGLSGTTGVVAPFEFGYTPGHLIGGGVAGHYRVGAYLNNSPAADVYLNQQGLPLALMGGSARMHNIRWGYYLMADQVVWQDANTPARTVTVFGNYSVGDRETGRYRRYAELGMVMESPFASRPMDEIALGTARAVINPRLVDYEAQASEMDDGLTVVQSFEQMIELNYAFKVRPWLTVRPDLQWITRPDASRTRSNIWAAGLVLHAGF